MQGDLNYIFIKDFPQETSEDEVISEFEQFGVITNFSIHSE